MSIDLRLPERDELTSRKFKIPVNLSAEFDLYVAAAKADRPDVDEHFVMQAILEKHLKKDRSFRTWLKKNKNRGEKKNS